MLQRVFGGQQGLGGVGTDVLRGGYPVSLQHQFPEGAGMIVMVGQQEEQVAPQDRIAAEPVELIGSQKLRVQQPRSGAVKLVVATD
ncbi:hypothetical protein D3C76_1701670 [compost metagenome]